MRKKRILLNLTEKEVQMLDIGAAKLGLSRSEFLRRLLDKIIEMKEKKEENKQRQGEN